MDVQPRYFVAISRTDSRFCCYLIWHKHTENTLTRPEKVSEHQHCMSESDHWWIGERLLDVCVFVSFALLAHSDFVHKIWRFRVSHSTTCLSHMSLPMFHAFTWSNNAGCKCLWLPLTEFLCEMWIFHHTILMSCVRLKSIRFVT